MTFTCPYLIVTFELDIGRENKMGATAQPDVNNGNNDTEKNVVFDGSSDEDKREIDYPRGIAKVLILAPVTFTYFLFFLDLAIVSTATPAITSSFNSLVDVGWYGGAYQLGSSAFQPLTGKIFRYFSIKVPYILHR